METFSIYILLLTSMLYSWLTLTLFAILQITLSSFKDFKKGFIVPGIYVLHMILAAVSGAFSGPNAFSSVKNLSPLALIFCIDGAIIAACLIIMLACRIWLKHKKVKRTGFQKIDIKDL